jgi:hypothetical protein
MRNDQLGRTGGKDRIAVIFRPELKDRAAAVQSMAGAGMHYIKGTEPSNLGNVGGGLSLLILFDGELDVVPFFQAAETRLSGNVGIMDEDIPARLAGNKTITLLFIEPLHNARFILAH